MARSYPVQSNQITLSSGADAVLAISAPGPGQVISLDTQTANTVFAGPTSGGAAVPTFRALVAADLPITRGSAVLVGGTVTVNTAAVAAGSLIWLTALVLGGTQGMLSVGTITAATSFVINSSNALDTSTVAWMIIAP
jgi:hypothetical protein